jgi:hypothetical protein
MEQLEAAPDADVAGCLWRLKQYGPAGQAALQRSLLVVQVSAPEQQLQLSGRLRRWRLTWELLAAWAVAHARAI